MQCRRFRHQIDAYLRNDLSETQRQEFENHYFSCQHCFDQLRIRRALMETNFNLKPMTIGEKVSKFRFRRHPALLAASLVIVIGASIMGLQWQRGKTLERISRFSPPVILVTETRNQQAETAYTEAVKAYQNGDYKDGVAHLSNIPEPFVSPKVRFLRGISRLLTKDPQGAAKDFEAIIAAMDPSYFDEALFYKGIALLRQGNVSGAKAVFMRLSGMFSPLKGEARKRLDMIEKAF
ncbi:MAG TPA: hypothetical protein ENN40_08925 [Candidatus Aminicenantes bacterium]|nr:hypothetical protein [Candidatus Aminicenantes bacterium]